MSSENPILAPSPICHLYPNLMLCTAHITPFQNCKTPTVLLQKIFRLCLIYLVSTHALPSYCTHPDQCLAKTAKFGPQKHAFVPHVYMHLKISKTRPYSAMSSRGSYRFLFTWVDDCMYVRVSRCGRASACVYEGHIITRNNIFSLLHGVPQLCIGPPLLWHISKATTFF
jgi:hypothetical protein